MNQAMQQDEVYLFDLWRIFIREWRWLVAVLVAILALTVAYTHVARPQWEATAWIQVGQIGATPVGEDPRIESFQRVIARMQTLAFQNEVLANAGFSVDAPESQLYRKSFKLEPDLYANLIRLSVRARSREQAGQLATATVMQVQAIHQRLEAAPLKLAYQRLQEIQTELQTALADRDRLQQASGQGGKSDSAGNPVLASMMLATKDADIHSLQQARSDLLYRLSSQGTFETTAPWPVYLPLKPASPNLFLTWAVGLLFGLFLGALAAIARSAARR